MSLLNVTIDDFDSIVSYSNQGDWETPNPQDNPSWFSEPDVTEWHEATYHKTSVVGTKVSLNFTGPSLYIYGASGPYYGSYSVRLDSSDPFTSSAFSSTNSTGRHLLFSSSNLTYGAHTVNVENLGSMGGGEGSELLVDLFIVGSEVGAVGRRIHGSRTRGRGKITRTRSSAETTYTNSDASFSFAFEGSAVWIYGDQVNDHGLFTLTINGSSPETYDNGSGCGGAFGKTCEKLGTLAYFKGGLGLGTHTVEVQNQPGVNNSFIDIDQIIYTTPSVYSSRIISNSTGNSPSSAGGSSSSSVLSASASAAASSTGLPSFGEMSVTRLGPLAWGLLGLAWIGRGIRL